MKNDPDAWHVPFAAPFVGVNPTYPIDGRETILDAYEQFAPTSTVGGYLSALERVQGRDASLPLDFDAYLAQRIPSAAHLGGMPDFTAIDRSGATA